MTKMFKQAHGSAALQHVGERGQAWQQIARIVARAGAGARAAARSLAERARGLRAISASSATTGRLVSARKVGAARSTSGAWREPARVSLRRRERF